MRVAWVFGVGMLAWKLCRNCQFDAQDPRKDRSCLSTFPVESGSMFPVGNGQGGIGDWEASSAFPFALLRVGELQVSLFAHPRWGLLRSLAHA